MSNVCAIILNYFGSNKTIACLSSLLDQELDAVMIVDNSGAQQANIQLQEALKEFRQRNLPFAIHQIVNQQNLGYAKGVNNALRWLEKNHPYSYYLLINNDAEATPAMLQELLIFMREHDRTVITSPMMDTGHKKIKYTWYHRFTGLMFSNHVLGTFPYLSGCCLLVDRRIIEDGLFDEDFFMYGEDVALSWRLKMSPYETAYAGKAIVKHEVTGSSNQGSFFYEYHMARGHILLARKLARNRWEIPFLFLGRLLAITARAIVRSARFRSLIPIKASLYALSKCNIASEKLTIETGLTPHV
jgi:N-acetylglucosaminyl-diphospho-decaprenol L-rhamnosyltransferase